MGKSIDISQYEGLTDEKLMAEAKRLRYEIQHPRLGLGDHLSNLFFSTVGIGTTVATPVAVIHNVIKQDKKEKGLSKQLRGLWEGFSDKEKLGKFKEKNPVFMDNLRWTVSSFALGAAIAAPIIYSYQKKERAEDNATKLSHAERILEERGYVNEAKERSL